MHSIEKLSYPEDSFFFALYAEVAKKLLDLQSGNYILKSY